MKKILLDTSAYTNLFKQYPLLETLVEEADYVYFSAVVYAELVEGFSLGNKERKNREHLERFLTQPQVHFLDITRETGEFWKSVRLDLRKNGTPIPINDVWIAAQALETGSVLVTYDDHFARVPGLRTWGE